MTDEKKKQPEILPPQKLADLERTPFVRARSGEWTLLMLAGKELVWGHRFDAGIGYRVYVKYKDSLMSNVFPHNEAFNLSNKIRRGEDDIMIIALANHIRDMAAEVKKLNALWAAAGAPDTPLDQMGDVGHA